MTTDPNNSTADAGKIPQVESADQTAAKSLRIWLNIVTIGASLTCLLTGAAAAFASFAFFFGFDSPDFTMNQFVNMQAGLWIGTLILAVLLIGGVAGGWRAFRKQRNRLALGLSLIAVLPICLCLAGIVAAVLTSSSPFPISVGVNS